MDKERIGKESVSLLAENGFELVDLKILMHGSKPLLQFFIDRENGGSTPPPASGPEVPASAKQPGGSPPIQPGGRSASGGKVGQAGGGVTLDDCGRMSEKLGAYIDVNDIITGGYILEISSPGIDRVLRNEKDFLRFKGSKAKIRLKKPVNNARVYYGEIVGLENGEVLLSDNLKFNLNDIEEARLHPGDDEV
ncbi:MAG: ribosome maturation factor RimP [Elusimicrobia bacterium]|nr:ribosome maturation factor RimP [Elusimicrobiota bacterium]